MASCGNRADVRVWFDHATLQWSAELLGEPGTPVVRASTEDHLAAFLRLIGVDIKATERDSDVDLGY